MMTHNCLVNIYRMTGDEDSKEFTLLEENVKVLLLTATNETIAFYPEYPIGTVYSFLFMDQVDDIKPEDKLVISNSLQSKLTENDEYVVKGKGATKVVLTHTVIDGVCVKV